MAVTEAVEADSAEVDAVVVIVGAAADEVGELRVGEMRCS